MDSDWLICDRANLCLLYEIFIAGLCALGKLFSFFCLIDTCRYVAFTRVLSRFVVFGLSVDVPPAVCSDHDDDTKKKEEKKRAVKSLIEKIPTSKEELFSYTVDWDGVDSVSRGLSRQEDRSGGGACSGLGFVQVSSGGLKMLCCS